VPKRDAAPSNEERRITQFIELNAEDFVFNQEWIAGTGSIDLQEKIRSAKFRPLGFLLALP
jgi:hypothetical protein